MNLKLPQWIWIWNSAFEFAVVNLNLQLWIWICSCEFEFAVVNLNLPWWTWICRGEFEIHGDPQVSRQNFLIHRKTLNSFHNTLKFGAKFSIIWATHFNHCKTFFLAAKLSSSRQNFLPHGKTFFFTAKLSSSRQNFLTKAKHPFSWQPFKRQSKSFLLVTKLFVQPVYNFRRTSWRGWRGSGVRLFYRYYFFRSLPALGRIFQTFCKLWVPFQVSVHSWSQSFICLL